MVRELFQMARSKKAAIIFFDEVDAIGGQRSEEAGSTGDSEVQRTMLEIVNQLDGFDARGNIKVRNYACMRLLLSTETTWGPRFLWRRIDRTHWTRRCCVLVAWTERSSLVFQI